MQFSFVTVFFFVAVGLLVPAAMLFVGRLVRPRVPRATKSVIYECGEVPVEQAWFNFNPRFYIIALVFLIFDVEVAFTYPVAVVFRRFAQTGRGALAFGELFAFLALLLLGLAYVWRRGDLEWIRRSDGEEDHG